MELAFGVLVVGVLAIWSVMTYNALVRKRNRVGNSWSQIDVQLNRRHELVPKLVDTARSYLDHERQVLENVVRARNDAMQAGGSVIERAALEGVLSRTLRSMFAVTEAYADLKANTTMLALQEELRSTENRIAFARQHYNDSVQAYVTTLQVFPANLVAQACRFKPAPLFELEDLSERATPVVIGV